MSNRSTRRQALAAIALADAPTPKEIIFRDAVIGLETDTVAQLRAWAEFFGATADDIKWSFDSPARFNQATTGRPMQSVNLYPKWRGWKTRLSATEYTDSIDVEPLDADTRAKLAEVAAGGETA